MHDMLIIKNLTSLVIGFQARMLDARCCYETESCFISKWLIFTNVKNVEEGCRNAMDKTSLR